jgi:cytochrome c556
MTRTGVSLISGAVGAMLVMWSASVSAEGGNSKPGVWSNWTDFSKRLDALSAATDELAKTAATGGIAVAGPKAEGLGCKSCHDQYMAPKN